MVVAGGRGEAEQVVWRGGGGRCEGEMECQGLGQGLADRGDACESHYCCCSCCVCVLLAPGSPCQRVQPPSPSLLGTLLPAEMLWEQEELADSEPDHA